MTRKQKRITAGLLYEQLSATFMYYCFHVKMSETHLLSLSCIIPLILFFPWLTDEILLACAPFDMIIGSAGGHLCFSVNSQFGVQVSVRKKDLLGCYLFCFSFSAAYKCTNFSESMMKNKLA